MGYLSRLALTTAIQEMGMDSSIACVAYRNPRAAASEVLGQGSDRQHLARSATVSLAPSTATTENAAVRPAAALDSGLLSPDDTHSSLAKPIATGRSARVRVSRLPVFR